MTNKEYLTTYLEGLGISEGEIEIIILDEGIDPNMNAEPRRLKTAIYNRIAIVLKSVTGNKTEGGYTVRWNMEAVKLFYSSLCVELGKQNQMNGPVIENPTAYW